MAENNKKYRFETLQLHVGQEQADPATDSRAVPIYQTTSYVFHNFDHAEARFGLADPGNIYGRLTNSTQGVFEDRIAALEGGTAGLAVASGAAAVEYAVRNITQSGDHIVAAKNVYGGTFNLLRHTLPRDGITTTFVSAENPQEFEDAIQENTKLVYFETFGNPNADLPDFEAITAIAHKHHLPVIVDNTFASPYLFRPLEHGADVVVESATKFIGGHGTTLVGVIVEGGKFNWAEVPGKFPTLTEPDPSYHGLNFYEALGGAAFVTRVRAILLRDTGATLSPVRGLPAAAGHRNPVPARRTPRPERAEGHRLPEDRSGSRVHLPPVHRRPQGQRAVQEVLPEWRRLHLHLRHQGRQGRGTRVHRQPAPVQPVGQRGRRQEPRDSPGLHHALPGDSGGARGSGHPPRHHPPVHRHREHRGHPR
ncbi:O-acetylhomoserine sulfhydrylase / O-succinylhomoserine sulfhydrylase [Bifidobacterium longum D2957]|nr:O-acetylhomoserine sulfhydrylase / O-succinylhomoserine sulfhydrylase [Bifidobacterium longum D2957]